MDSTTFYEKAKPLIALGIPVFPLVPGDKYPPSTMKGWQKERKFSTDLAVIEGWNQENPDYNVAMAAMAEDDGFCFLEFDGKPGLKTICEELGREYPDTRIHRSGKGGGHYIFKHTPETLALGNRQACLPDGGEWFSFRADRKFLVGAGSLHPNGRRYEVVRDNAPVDMPDWLVTWVEENSRGEQAPKRGEALPVADDFDFDHWCDHYSEVFTIKNAHEEGWMTTDACPWVGHRHSQSFMTGFYYDGETLGFHCFAAGCEGYGQGIGATIKMMNEKVGPYSYLVWQEEDQDHKWGIDDVSPHRVVSPEELFGEETLKTPEPIVVAPETPVEAPEPIQAIVPMEKPLDPLKMPADVMYGKLGQYAHEMKMPLGLGYPALLACWSAKLLHDEMVGCRVNVYVCLMAALGGGKDQARERACIMTGINEGHDYIVAMPASDRGIQTLLGDQPGEKKGMPRIPGPRKMLLVTEEIEELVKKGSIDKSGMFQTLQTLWDGNRKTFADRQGKAEVNCRLSWLGGIPVNGVNAEKFSSIFGETSTHGLLSRFIFGYSGVKWNYRRWNAPVIEHSSVDICPGGEYEGLQSALQTPTCVEAWSPDAEAFYEVWESVDESGRDKYYLHKIAILTASANGEKVINLECVQAAARFMAWQQKLREVFQPGIAENMPEARATERIMSAMRRVDTSKNVGGKILAGYINWRRLNHDNKWSDTFGAPMVNRVIKGLIDCGLLIPMIEEREDGSGKPGKPDTKWLQVARVGKNIGEGETGSTENRPQEA